MAEKKKVPQIRFKGFSEEWEEKKLGELMNVTSVKRIHQSDWTNSGIRFLRARDIVSAFKNEEPADYLYISEEKYYEYSFISGKVKPNDLLVTGVGTIGVPFIIIDENPVYFKDGNVIWFQNNNTIDGKFFFYSFTGNIIQNFIKDSAGTGTVGTYTIDSGKKTPILLPKHSEQSQIGNYFQNLDKLITLHQRKCDKLVILKKAMLEKMFPKNGSDVPEIRFKGFEGKWEEKKLGEIGNTTSGTSIESEFSDDGKYKVISIGSYSENSTYKDQGIYAVESDKTIRRILNKNDLTMILNDKTSSGNIIGRVLRILENDKFVYNQRTQRIEPFKDKYDAVFLYQLLNAPLIREKIIKSSQGNTQIYVNWSAIKEFVYLIPKLPEQKKIGNYFQNLDKLISLHQKELEKLKNIKKACLEKMFV